MTTPERSTPRPPLSGPYRAAIGPGPLAVSPAVSDLVSAQVRALLSSSAAWHELSPRARAEMRRDLEKIGAYTAALVQEDFALSDRLGQTPVLRRSDPDPLAAAAAARPAPAPATPPPGQEVFASRAIDNVGRVTKDTLGAIAFPTFVADLIKGTFNAIVDASIKQMEAFGTLLSNVAKTVDQFMSDNITDNQARDWLAATYPRHFQVTVGKGEGGGRGARRRGAARTARGPRGGRAGGDDDAPAAQLRVRAGGARGGTPNFRQDLGLPRDVDLDDKSAEEVLVPAARRRLAQQRHQLLSTMVLMGVNRIVITSGRIYARMGFYIDASDQGAAENASQFDEHNDTIAGGSFLGFGAATKNSVSYVSSQKRNSSDEINVQADLTGEVDLKFKSETFPLERFADTNAIAQIQGATANPTANTPQSSINTPAAPGAAT